MSEQDEVLTLDALIARAHDLTHTLYDGVLTPHRSCGISLAETYARPTPAYQSLRRGGITGCGECGAIKAGELILGELLGDPDPTAGVTPELAQAAVRYRELWRASLPHPSIICNDLTSPFADFRGPQRHAFCTQLAATASACVARTLAEVSPDTLRQLPLSKP